MLGRSLSFVFKMQHSWNWIINVAAEITSIKESTTCQANTCILACSLLTTKMDFPFGNLFSCRAAVQQHAEVSSVQELKNRTSAVVSSNSETLSELRRASLLSGLDSYNFENLICSYGNPTQTVQRWIVQIFTGTVGQRGSQRYSWLSLILKHICTQLCRDIEIVLLCLCAYSFAPWCDQLMYSMVSDWDTDHMSELTLNSKWIHVLVLCQYMHHIFCQSGEVCTSDILTLKC